MYAEMGNDDLTEMQLRFQDSCTPSVFIMTPKVGGTSLNLIVAHYAVITQKFWELNEQRQPFTRDAQPGQNRVTHTCLLNTSPGGNNNCASDLHQQSGMAQKRVLHGLMSQPSITTSIIHRILQSCEDQLKLLTVNGDTFQSDEQSSDIVKYTLSRYSSLDIQPT